MKPISLKFRGINSYEEEFYIDFESLAKDGIFGIFGPTGSGKSTILDAITLALYGKIPRHDKNTHSYFINNASDTAQVEFTFETAGSNGEKQQFEIHRAYKRNTKDGANVSKCLFRLVDGDILADRKEGEVNAAIIAVVSLSYEDFTRSVFLPQGKFNEFMFLKSRDRSKMLERLFDLEKFGESLKTRVNAFENRAKTAVETCELKISFYGEISSEVLELKQNQLDDISKEIICLADERELIFVEREKYRELDAAYTRYLTTQNQQLAHASRSSEIKATTKLLDDAKRAEALRLPLDNLKSLATQYAQAVEGLELTQRLAKATQEKAMQCDKEYQAARKAMEIDFPALLKKEQELNAHLERLTEIEAAEKDLFELRHKWKMEDGNLKEIKNKEKEISIRAAKIKDKLNDIERRKSITDVSPEILKTLIDAASVEKELHKNDDDTRLAKDSLQELGAKEQMLSELFVKSQNDAAILLAQHLYDGVPCPVCGSLHHPNPANHLATSTEQLSEDFEGIAAQLGRIRAIQENTVHTLEKLTQDRTYLAAKLVEYQQSFDVDNFATALDDAFAKNAERATLDEQETALRAESDIVAAEQKSLMLEISRIEAIQETTLAAGTETATAIEAKRVSMAAYGDASAAKFALAEVESRKLKLTMAEKESEDLRAKYQAEYIETEKALASLAERVQGLDAMYNTQQNAIAKELESSGFSDILAAEAAILPHPQIATLDAEIKEYEQKKSEIANSLDHLSNILDGIDSVEKIPEIAHAVQEKFIHTDAALIEKREAAAILSQDVAKMVTDLETVSELIAQKKQLQVHHASVQEIAYLFRGNAFIKFLAMRHLQYITNEATIRLARMTGGRYAIEYDEDTNFIIRDDFNGGTRRPPASLSGGETFMVALCLALALSAKIQMKSRTDLSFFFLDEGFGALDSDSLTNVMDALAQLHEENMTVGLISHVEEMKHRIHNKIEL